MTIKNQRSITDSKIEDLRAAYEHRAAWFYLLLDEAEKKGIDPEEFARKAVRRCGNFHGEVKFTDTDDIEKFAQEFATENSKKIFEMNVEVDEEKMVVEFNYCPLVAAWQKFTDDEDKIDLLCDIAMEGDRGIISKFPDFTFDLQDTIASGGDVCRVVVEKKE